MTKTPYSILKKACSIIELADENYGDFASLHSQFMIGMGEREFDGALYGIILSDEYILVVRTEEYQVIDFEIRSRLTHEKLVNDEMFEMWYPTIQMNTQYEEIKNERDVTALFDDGTIFG